MIDEVLETWNHSLVITGVNNFSQAKSLEKFLQKLEIGIAPLGEGFHWGEFNRDCVHRIIWIRKDDRGGYHDFNSIEPHVVIDRVEFMNLTADEVYNLLVYENENTHPPRVRGDSPPY